MKARGKIRKYIEDYKFNSLFFKNLLLLLFLILIPLAGTTILAYYAYGSMQKNDLRAYHEKITADAYSDIERILKEARTELTYIGFNSNVELFMYDTEEIKQLNYRLSTIEELIRLPVISRDYIRNIFIYSYKSDKVISNQGISEYENFLQKDCIDTYLSSDKDFKEVLVTTGTEYGYAEKQLSVFQEVKYGSVLGGISVMNLDIEALKKEIYVPEHEKLYLISGDTILYSNDTEWVGKKTLEVAGLEQRVVNGTYLGSEYSISSKASPLYPLEVITYLSVDGYQNQLSTVKNFMIIFLLVMGAITLGVSAFISIRIFQPIGAIVSSIQQNRNVLMGEGELFREKDELEYILRSIQKTANLKKDVDEELSQRVRLLKKAQAVALQSQINPHFLNNTLDTINWMAIGLLGGKNEISEMTGALSKMLRMSLENTDTIIPMSQEIEHCMYYLEIQNKRYEDKFKAVWQIPEEIYRYKTIRVILQPIVENAIYHGIKHLTNQGMITISGRIEGEIVEITVRDNGLGMSREELERLREQMKSQVIKESRHIGINNVNQRIKLYFGDEYGVFIESEEGVGTEVTIRFPGITEEAAVKTHIQEMVT